MEQIQNCKLVLSKASYYPSSVEIFDFYKQLGPEDFFPSKISNNVYFIHSLVQNDVFRIYVQFQNLSNFNLKKKTLYILNQDDYQTIEIPKLQKSMLQN